MKRILYLLLIFIVTNAHLNQCISILSNWIGNPQSLSPIVYANSGKLLNDLGDYNNCLFHKDQYIYLTMQVYNRLAFSFQYMGLCAPIQCRGQITSIEYAQKIQLKLNRIYQNTTHSKFAAFSRLKFYNPHQAQPKLDLSNYLAIGFIVFLILLGVIGSFIGQLKTKQSTSIKILQSFSIYNNLSKIFTIPTHTENDNLLFLNGMRVLSIFWIVYGHDMWVRTNYIKNWTQKINILSTPGFVTLAPAGYFAVDTFFWIGGLLVTIGMLEQIKKAKSFISFYFAAVLHRFVRIWPTYMIAIIVFWKIMPYLGSGPIWQNFYELTCNCNNGAVLQNMLFIDNFGEHGPNGMKYCFGWSWYLAVDFQLFLITPFFLYAYAKNKKLGWIITFTLFFASVMTAFIQIYVNNWRYPMPNPKFSPQPDFMDKFYYKPWIRASAYFMGIFSGFIYVEWKNGDATINKYVNKVKHSVVIRTLFYIIGIGLTQFVIWIIVPFQTGEEWSTLTQAFYNSLNRVFFLIGVYLCVFAAMFGCKNDPSRLILGHWFFSPLAKVSFCTYLVHLIVIFKGAFSVKSIAYWQIQPTLYGFTSDLFWCVIYAIVLTCLIEAPILGLQRIFLRPTIKQNKQKAKMAKTQDKSVDKLQISSQQIVRNQVPQCVSDVRLQTNNII